MLLFSQREHSKASMQTSPQQASIELRLQRVISYLHTHLNEDLDLNKLAEIACMSPCHWHRVYLAVYGESVVATVKRLRLQGAATLLTRSDLPITKIARQSGYPNVQSFTRIFAAAYGLPPARYRKEGGPFSLAAPLIRNKKMYPIEIKTIPAIPLLSVAHTGSYMGINHAFDLIASNANARQLFSADTRWIGIFLDDPCFVAEEKLRSKACISIPPGAGQSAPFMREEISSGKYAVLSYKGPYSDMKAVYQWLYGEWLSASGEELADTPVFEEYRNNPRDTAPNELLTDIYLPLR